VPGGESEAEAQVTAKVIHIGSVSIPLDSYAVGGTAVLGIRESGKTYAAKNIAEQLLEHGVPIVVFDAIGVWRYLKVAGSGPKAKGLKIVVAGGREPDLPLTPESAPEIVRAAIRENIPLVIDLYSKQLSKGDWRKIVQNCFRTLLYENEGLRHIILEETAEYAPQKVMDGQTYAEVEKLVRMGGNASLGITLINQRAQEVNKAILDLCENLILMRQRGAHAIDSLEKWMDRLDPGTSRAVSLSMPHMEQGDAWVFTGTAEAPVRTHTTKIHSFHPDRRNPQPIAKGSASPAVDTAEFVQRLSGELETHLAEVKANDPEVLKAEIRKLKEQIADQIEERGGARLIDETQLQEALQRGFVSGIASSKRAVKNFFFNVVAANKATVECLEQLDEYIKQPDDADGEYNEALGGVITFAKAPPAGADVGSLLAGVNKKTGAGDLNTGRPSAAGRARDGDGTLGAAEKKFLTVLAQRRGKTTTRNQVAIFAGYSAKSRHVDNTLGALRAAGLAEGGGDDIRITPTGLTALGSFQPLPTGRALRDYWIREAGGVAESSMLRVILEAYPNSLTRDQVAVQSRYSPSSRHVDNTLGRLRSLDLITGPGSAIKASKELF
jgi:uncharacterized protein